MLYLIMHIFFLMSKWVDSESLNMELFKIEYMKNSLNGLLWVYVMFLDFSVDIVLCKYVFRWPIEFYVETKFYIEKKNQRFMSTQILFSLNNIFRPELDELLFPFSSSVHSAAFRNMLAEACGPAWLSVSWQTCPGVDRARVKTCFSTYGL